MRKPVNLLIMRARPPQFVVDPKGNRTAVLLDVDDYARLLEDLDDLKTFAERRKERSISHDEFVSRLKKRGIL